MIKSLLTIAFVFASIFTAHCGCEMPKSEKSSCKCDDNSEQTSIIAIIAHPKNYMGKKVKLFGYLGGDDKFFCLYLTKEDFRYANVANSILIGNVKSAQVFRGYVNITAKLVPSPAVNDFKDAWTQNGSLEDCYISKARTVFR